jgi:ABC-type polysaccharide/polyol phosphate transport system ATPase subunit
MHIIEVSHLTKEYRLGAMQGLKQTLLNSAAKLAGKPVKERPQFKALDDVSFSIEQGEVVGIIGHNGAGKSTLLKMLARISTPTSGEIKVNGRIAPLIEVGAGFVPDFTGRENVYLNGSIMGLSKKEIDRKFDEIVDFAEMEEFIDTPVKRYSSGMQVKLAFAVATSIDAEILIVDEVLAVGDLAFQRKCFDRMEDMIKRQGKTVLLVSHNIRQVERLCDRVILMDHGRINYDGGATEGCNRFYDQSNAKINASLAVQKAKNVRESEQARVEHICILDASGQETQRIPCLAPMSFRMRFTATESLREVVFLFGTHTTDFVYLGANNSGGNAQNFEVGTHLVTAHLDFMRLLPGTYSVRVWIGTPHGKEFFYGENLATFQVFSDDYLISQQQGMGLVYMEDRWEFGRVA